MITTKEVKIKINSKFTSDYIETELANRGYDVLRWAVTSADDEFYTLDIAVVQE